MEIQSTPAHAPVDLHASHSCEILTRRIQIITLPCTKHEELAHATCIFASSRRVYGFRYRACALSARRVSVLSTYRGRCCTVRERYLRAELTRRCRCNLFVPKQAWTARLTPPHANSKHGPTFPHGSSSKSRVALCRVPRRMYTMRARIRRLLHPSAPQEGWPHRAAGRREEMSGRARLSTDK
jgi:hypothetical protein